MTWTNCERVPARAPSCAICEGNALAGCEFCPGAQASFEAFDRFDRAWFEQMYDQAHDDQEER